MGGGGGAAITPDGNQLAFVVSDGGKKHEVKFWDLATGRESRTVNLPDKEIDSIELAFTADGRLLVSGIIDKRLKLWDLSGKGNEREVTPTATDHGLIKFSRDGRLLAVHSRLRGETLGRRDLARIASIESASRWLTGAANGRLRKFQ